jgi:3-oxoacyl-[acyl-carrier-protein] synthase II
MARLARQHRVVVTGLGVLAPNGIGLDAFWQSLLKCKSGIGLITLFDSTEFPVRIAGEVKDFDIRKFVSGQVKAHRLGRHTQLALAATYFAIKHAGLERAMLEACAPVPVIIGVSTSAMDIIQRGEETMSSHGPAKVSPYIVSAGHPHAVASAISESLGISTKATTVSTACPAGLDAISIAVESIRSGRAEIAIAGGADAPISPLTVACFGATGLVPKNSSNPEKLSRPFDRDRQGGILAEGAGILILENLEHALARGATPLAEIAGYGTSVDASGSLPASGLEDSMSLALANAGCRPENIDYICAHGPSDPVLDKVETACIKKAFGSHAYKIPVSSIKGVTGNPLAAAGPLELATCVMAIQHALVPPTANYEHPDNDCDLDYVPLKPRKMDINRALINIHGLGNCNSTMIINRVS